MQCHKTVRSLHIQSYSSITLKENDAGDRLGEAAGSRVDEEGLKTFVADK